MQSPTADTRSITIRRKHLQSRRRRDRPDLLYLLIIVIAVFLAALIPAALRMRRRPGRRPAR